MSVLLDVAKRVTPPLLVEYRRYYREFGRFPNLYRPSRFSERVLYRKLFERNPLHTTCTDKFAVRDYVSGRVGSDVLVPLLLATSRPRDLHNLRSWARTAIKPNHASMVVELLPRDEPTPARKAYIIKQCERWLSIDFSRSYNEWHYTDIKPRILVEEFVGKPDEPASELKIHCFVQHDGRVDRMIQLISDRFGTKAMSFHFHEGGSWRRVRAIGDAAPKIEDIDQTLLADALARSDRLAQDFSYVRVDWMVSSGKLFFSELTFTPGAGLSPTFGDSLDRRTGAMWVL